MFNKANLRNLIAATGLVILLRIGFRSSIFFACVTLKFDGWPRKPIGHIFITTSSFVHHFKAIGEFKLELQSGNINAQFGSKLPIFWPAWPQIWRMTLRNNRAPLLYYIKHDASFHSHRWIQTGVTVRKLSLRVKINDFLSRATLEFGGWPWKTIGHIFYATSSFVHHFIISWPSVNSNWNYSPETPNLGQNRPFF